METIFMYIMPVLIITSIIYYVLIVAKIKNKALTENSKIINALIGKEKETRSKYLHDENRFLPISKIIVKEEVLGITDCMKHKSTTEVVGKVLKNLAESAMRKITFGSGSRFEFEEDNGSCYLVNTNIALHYIEFKEGGLIIHQRFQFNEIQDFDQSEANIADQAFKGGGYKLPKISFKTTTSLVTFYYFESINYYPSGEPLETNTMYEVNHLFVTPFKSKIDQL